MNALFLQCFKYMSSDYAKFEHDTGIQPSSCLFAWELHLNICTCLRRKMSFGYAHIYIYNLCILFFRSSRLIASKWINEDAHAPASRSANRVCASGALNPKPP